MAKLKDLLRPKSLDYVLSSKKVFALKGISSLAWAAIRSYGTNNAQFDKNAESTICAFKDRMFYEEMMRRLGKTNSSYHAALYGDIKKRGPDAEIDIDYLERLFPKMSDINDSFKIYNKPL